jgi:hypothetical protein
VSIGAMRVVHGSLEARRRQNASGEILARGASPKLDSEI